MRGPCGKVRLVWPSVLAYEASVVAVPRVFLLVYGPGHFEAVRANESRLAQENAPIGNRDWWYLVAAIAVGVIIAALLL